MLLFLHNFSFYPPKGSIIKREMVIIKRPGIGIEPKYFDKIIGKKSKKRYKKKTKL